MLHIAYVFSHYDFNTLRYQFVVCANKMFTSLFANIIEKNYYQVIYKNLMNVSVASFDINTDSFLFVYSRWATT